MRYIFSLILTGLLLLGCGLFEDDTQSKEASASLTTQAGVSSELVARQLGDVGRYLAKYRITGAKANEIRQYVQERKTPSATRAVHEVTQLPLPDAKRVVDTLYHLVHGDPL